MSAKRQATTNLNHENWDQEEEPEVRGTFRKASEDELKNRVIKKARRKAADNTSADVTEEGAPKSVFSGFSGFDKPASSAPTSSPFSFLSKISAPADSNNVTTPATFSFSSANKDPVDSNNTKNNATFSFRGAANAPVDSSNSKNTASFSLGSAAKTPVDNNTATFSFGAKGKAAMDGNITNNAATFSFGDGNKAPVSSEIKNVSPEKEISPKVGSFVSEAKSTSYQSKIKSLNQAVTEWIKTHVDKNPLCILSPIFKDYEKYITEIEEEEMKIKNVPNNNFSYDNQIPSSSATTFKLWSSPKLNTTSTSGAAPTLSFGSKTSPAVSAPSNMFTSGSKPSTETTKTSTFNFGIKSTENNNRDKDQKTSQGFSFGLKSDATNGEPAEKTTPFSFAPGSAPFSFGNIKPPAPSTTDSVDDEEDQPPKVEFKQVVEDDAVYSKKCKVFVKKDGAFAERGVGTLYLKPVKDSEKMQLLVRADTNLGNILVNLILSEGIPTQRMGKNNVMMVCLPTPDVEKVASMLLRVKTAEEADELLAELEKHKK
ncbi:nuclear pore complex protein Nup50 isoform X2 [Eurosta solidaginis]|uniref:nuclear pore complex protein Nup50 isoform X2 n=1 Tax=Eurosta solidaginis TaxID=178769 RepID=UPI003530C9D6